MCGQLEMWEGNEVYILALSHLTLLATGVGNLC